MEKIMLERGLLEGIATSRLLLASFELQRRHVKTGNHSAVVVRQVYASIFHIISVLLFYSTVD